MLCCWVCCPAYRSGRGCGGWRGWRPPGVDGALHPTPCHSSTGPGLEVHSRLVHSSSYMHVRDRGAVRDFAPAALKLSLRRGEVQPSAAVRACGGVGCSCSAHLLNEP